MLSISQGFPIALESSPAELSVLLKLFCFDCAVCVSKSLDYNLVRLQSTGQ